MKAISLHQPWASLLATRQPCETCNSAGAIANYEGDALDCPRCEVPRMVKRFETRSWPCPPALIGQPIAIHATKQIPADQLEVGEYACWNTTDGCSMLAETIGRDGYTGQPIADLFGEWLPLGAVVGSGRITASLPIVSAGSGVTDKRIYAASGGLLALMHGGGDFAGEDWDEEWTDISDQLPYGDFTPGRYAWLIEDAAPTSERCPWCWGDGGDPDSYEALVMGAPEVATKRCPLCLAAGRCDPIPKRGHQRIWNWTPS